MEFLRVLRSESDRDTRNLLIVAVFSGILGILLVALIVGSAQKVSPGQLDTVNLVTSSSALSLTVPTLLRSNAAIEIDSRRRRA